MNLSLKARNAIAIIVLLIITISIVLGVAYHEMQEVLYDDIDSDLYQESQTISSIIQNEYINEENKDLDWKDEIKAFMLPRKLKYKPIFRIWQQSETENLLASDPINSNRYKCLMDVASPPSNKKNYIIMSIYLDNKEYRAIWSVFQPTNYPHKYNIVIAKSAHYALHEIEEFRKFLLILSGIITAISGLIVTLIIRKGLKPINQLAKKLKHVHYENLGEQDFDFGNVPAELQPFVNSTSNMLERLNISALRQKEFISDAAHELRTPLTIAKSTLQASLLKASSEKNYKEAIEEGLSDVRRMEQLITQLLELARVESANTATYSEIQLDELLDGLTSQFKDFHESDNIVLSPVACKVSGNKNELSSLFSNLIDNAIKHGPDNSQIEFFMETSGNSVTVSVHDTGGTISAEDLEKIFERFYRTDPSRARFSGGSGIGLSIAQRIAIKHGGNISVKSNPDDGTTFYVKLPKL